MSTVSVNPTLCSVVLYYIHKVVNRTVLLDILVIIEI